MANRAAGRRAGPRRGLGGVGLQGLGRKHRRAGLLRCFTSCLDMSGMTQGYSLHLGSKSEKNIPLARGTLCAHAFQTQNYSAAAAHLASGPAPCLQRAPTAGCLPGAWGGELKSLACGHRMCYSGQPPSDETTTSWTPFEQHVPK